jgi:hypothetical protein
MSVQNGHISSQQGSGLGLILRLFWMFFGNAILFISVIVIAQNKGGIFHTADVVFWITVLMLLIVRYLDIQYCGGYTATDKPATMSHWKKYLILLLLCSGAMWLLGHIINYFLVNK